jgi:hypothetical protein
MDKNRNEQQGNEVRSQDSPNQNANKEPAEGSRDTVRGNLGADREARPRDVGERNEYPRDDGDQGGGITNRPLDRELKEQSQVPPRGQTKDEDRNA